MLCHFVYQENATDDVPISCRNVNNNLFSYDSYNADTGSILITEVQSSETFIFIYRT